MTKIIPVILSGGVGSRLWPVSRTKRPKPFMWVEPTGSLLNRTFNRLGGIGVSDIISVTNEQYRFFVERTASDFNFNNHLILEPFGKNTAGAIGVSAKYIKQHFGDDAVLVVLPSDHIINDIKSFEDVIKNAVSLAQNGHLTTIGITPTKPHTGYGYIKSGEAIDNGFKVDAFVEKPNEETAKGYIADGGYFWNAGMFVFTAGGYLDALKQNANDVYDVVDKIDTSNKDFVIDEKIFSTMPDISIDYAVMEKADNVAVVPATFDWNDLGAWDSIAETLPTDKDGNSYREVSDVVMKDTKNTTVFSTSQDKLIATVGVNDLTIVETRDAVLIADSNKLQGVKDIVNELKSNNHEAVDVHRTEHRPWGTFTILDEGEGYKVKQIMVLPHQKLSLQSHKHRSEHWVVVSGVATVENDGEVLKLNANESTYISAGHKHRLSNDTDAPVLIVEVQTGDYLGEDDIERFEDIYDR
ncbi:MAG: mannose-1-phosphate guanylyltransferase/mannose-6-phosphate isomerase [Alphaproteobacteria bacterium]